VTDGAGGALGDGVDRDRQGEAGFQEPRGGFRYRETDPEFVGADQADDGNAGSDQGAGIVIATGDLAAEWGDQFGGGEPVLELAHGCLLPVDPRHGHGDSGGGQFHVESFSGQLFGGPGIGIGGMTFVEEFGLIVFQGGLVGLGSSGGEVGAGHLQVVVDGPGIEFGQGGARGDQRAQLHLDQFETAVDLEGQIHRVPGKDDTDHGRRVLGGGWRGAGGRVAPDRVDGQPAQKAREQRPTQFPSEAR